MDDHAPAPLHHDRGWLIELKDRITELLAALRLRPHPGKTAVVPTRGGMTLVGDRTWPYRRIVRGANFRLFLNRCRAMRKWVEAGQLTLADVSVEVVGWVGHAAQADSLKLFALSPVAGRLRYSGRWGLRADVATIIRSVSE